MAEFDAGVTGRKLPINLGFVLVSGAFPRSDLRTEGRCVGNASVKTLRPQGAELYLGHIQPTTVFWPEVKLGETDRFISPEDGGGCSKLPPRQI